MKIARCLDFGAARRLTALAHQAAFFQQKLSQMANIVRRDPRRRLAQYAWLDQAAGGKNLASLFGRGIGDEGAAVLLDADKAFIGERLQGGARKRAADVEEIADIAF